MNKSFQIGFVLILVFLLAGGTGFYFGRKNPKVNTIYVSQIKSDTIKIFDTIIIHVPGRVKFIKDTAFVEKYIFSREVKDTIFVSCIDTSLNRGQISICYSFPQNTFEVDAKWHADTIVKILEIKEERIQWYEYLIPAGIGFLLGLAVR